MFHFYKKTDVHPFIHVFIIQRIILLVDTFFDKFILSTLHIDKFFTKTLPVDNCYKQVVSLVDKHWKNVACSCYFCYHICVFTLNNWTVYILLSTDCGYHVDRLFSPFEKVVHRWWILSKCRLFSLLYIFPHLILFIFSI